MLFSESVCFLQQFEVRIIPGMLNELLAFIVKLVLFSELSKVSRVFCLSFFYLLLIACRPDPIMESNQIRYTGRFDANWSRLSEDSIGGQHSVRWDSNWAGTFDMFLEGSMYFHFTYALPPLPFRPLLTEVRVLNSGKTYRVNMPSGFWEIILTPDSLFSVYEYQDSTYQAPEFYREQIRFEGTKQP